MSNYLLQEDDGLPMRESGAWVAEKLDYLERYIDVFETSMRKKPWRARHYIDLFAGPGKCIGKESGNVYLGSPILALVTKHPFTEYFFADLEVENIDALQKRCAASSLSERIQYFTGDCNEIVHEIVDYINQVDSKYIDDQTWSSLNLAFLDPDGLQLEWDTVATLAQVRKMDLVIHYSQIGLTRNLSQCYESEEETIIDCFFGDTEWRTIYRRQQRRGKSSGQMPRVLIDYYKNKLKDLGYTEIRVETEPLIRNKRRRAPLYRLLFASKDELAYKFWEEITSRNVHGQRRLPL